jgi:quercetin dioxygenase-like cupin family protein
MSVRVIAPEPAHTTATPNATMTRLATPTLGSRTLSTWRVEMEAGATGPTHTVDREQVWTLTTGTLTFTTTGEGEGALVTAGQTVVVPAGLERRVQAGDRGARAHVAMPSDGRVSTPEQGPHPLPWAS